MVRQEREARHGEELNEEQGPKEVFIVKETDGTEMSRKKEWEQLGKTTAQHGLPKKRGVNKRHLYATPQTVTGTTPRGCHLSKESRTASHGAPLIDPVHQQAGINSRTARTHQTAASQGKET